MCILNVASTFFLCKVLVATFCGPDLLASSRLVLARLSSSNLNQIYQISDSHNFVENKLNLVRGMIEFVEAQIVDNREAHRSSVV